MESRSKVIKRLRELGVRFDEPVPPRKRALWGTEPVNGEHGYFDIDDLLRWIERKRAA